LVYEQHDDVEQKHVSILLYVLQAFSEIHGYFQQDHEDMY
jgi:hypothetical protein